MSTILPGFEAGLAALLLIWVLRLSRRHRALARRHAVELERLTDRDGLTGLGNERALVRDLALGLHRSRRTREPITLLWLDIDAFAEVTRSHGRAEGDRTLRALGAVMRSSLRFGTDACYRIAGDQFAVVVAAGREGARTIGLRLDWNLRERTPRQSGLRAGVAVWDGRSSPEGLIEQARRAPRARPSDASVTQTV